MLAASRRRFAPLGTLSGAPHPMRHALHHATRVTSTRHSSPRRAASQHRLCRQCFGQEPLLLTHLPPQHFDAVLGPDISGTTKPEPTMLRMAMARMGCAPDSTVYVGDMVLDVESAARAGVPVILVPGGSSDRESLLATGAPLLERFEQLVDG